MNKPVPQFSTRLRSLQQSISANEWWLLSSPYDVQYFTNFGLDHSPERTALLWASRHSAILAHSPFSTPPHEAHGVHLISNLQFSQHLALIAKSSQQPTRIRFDESDVRYLEFSQLNAAAESIQVTEILSLDRQMIWKLRSIKDVDELASIAEAGNKTAHAMQFGLQALKEGLTEIELARQIDAHMRTHQGEPAFPTIVAFGAHTALPHHLPGDTALVKNQPVLIDLGVRFEQYCADMTRTAWFGSEPTPQFANLETTIKAAYKSALSQMRRGSPIAAVDTAARDVIKRAGFGENFIHTTGHGIGLEIHEPPSVYQSTTGELQSGMVITIEPGIYLSGEMGYRFENTVVVQKSPKTVTI